MLTKRRHLDGRTTQPARISLPHLPIEILAEILLSTGSPLVVLAVSRTCSFLHRSLALSPGAAFIWRGVRRAYKVPLPDPVEGWRGTEADYAAFVFGGGVCEVCQKNTREMYVSFSARIRLCGGWHCRSKFLSNYIVYVGAGFKEQSLWVPPLESTRCLYPSRSDAPIWPYCETLIRKTEWEAYKRDLKAFKHAERARAEGKEDEETKSVLERCRAARRKFTRIMEVSRGLIEWKWKYDRALKDIKKENETWTQALADNEGWDLGLLVASSTYGSLQRCKNLHLEKIGLSDVIPIQSTIESELLTMQAHRQRQKAEATYREKLIEVKKIYDRIRCGTIGGTSTGSAGSTDPLILPPLSVFFTLPSVRALKGSPDPSTLPVELSSATVTNDINSSLAISLITTDVRTWLIPVQKHLMTVLGLPDVWQSANTRAVHPLKRVTARFFCRRCGEGNVGKRYQRELCLNFRGVCSHVCKRAGGGHQKESEIEANIGDGKDKNKKSGGNTPDWTVDKFEKDEKAISLVKRILHIKRLSEDNPDIGSATKAIGPSIRCKTCKGWIVMDFETAIGHAHRHECMEIQMLPTFIPNMAVIFKQDASKPNGTDAYHIPYAQLKFERGNTELLLGPLPRAKDLCKKVNYGCKHCFLVSEGMDTVVGFEKARNKGVRAMSFHGLRSHVKEKPDIQDIRDEDFFCYTSIREG